MIYSRILTYLHTDPLALLLFAAICGMIVGVEREINHKPAGIRTCGLVSLATCALALLTQMVSPIFPDRGHIAANIVQGLGFLCAGTIITNRDKVIGLTTAAAIWAVAAIGMSIGFGKLILALETTFLTMIIMFGIGVLERKYFVENPLQFAKKRSKKHEQ